MSGQISARRPPDVAPERRSLLSKFAARSMPSSTDHPTAPSRNWPSPSVKGTDRRTFKTVSPGSTPRRRSIEPGILCHLACVGVVATMIIAVFFGAGLYSLRQPTEEPISRVHNDEAPAASTAVAPSSADPPPIFTASLGVLSDATPDAPQLSATATPLGQAPQTDISPTRNRGGHRSHRHHHLSRR